MTTDNNSLAIFQPQNVQTIVSMGPQAFNDNTLSHSRCLAAGQALLQRAEDEGMTDELDQAIARFIEKSKATVKKMNTKRSPVTKLFDQLRAVYTTLENEVDPSKSGSLPNKLQQLRNAYAAKKLAEAEAARRAELQRQQRQQALAKYRTDLEDDFKAQLTRLIARQCNALAEMDNSITLDNYEIIYDGVKNFPVQLPADWGQTVQSSTRTPAGISIDEAARIQSSILSSALPRFCEQYTFEVGSTRDDILDRMPSKRAELQRIAAADAQEAARIKELMRQRELAEAQRKEAERLEREAKDKAAAELKAQSQEMDTLFGAPVAQINTYQPKTSVKKRIIVTSHDDIMAIVGCWWAQEGSQLPLEDLIKSFKKQITFCERLANDRNNPIFITNVRYDDDVKAK